MGPAAGYPHLVRMLLFVLVVSLIPIRYQYAFKAFQESLRMRGITGLLVVVKDDLLLLRISAVYPHPALCAGLASILAHLHPGFIGMCYMHADQLPVKPVIHKRQVPLCQLDHPSGHHLSADIGLPSFELFLHAVQRDGIHVFCVQDPCCQGRRYDAACQKLCRVGCTYNGFFAVFPSGVYCKVVLLYQKCCRLEFQLGVDIVLQPVVLAVKALGQFFIAESVQDLLHRKCGKIRLTFSFCLLPFPFVGRNGLLGERFFCFADRNLCFIQRDLHLSFQLICLTSIVSGIGQVNLLCQIGHHVVELVHLRLLFHYDLNQFFRWDFYQFFSFEYLISHGYIIPSIGIQKKPFLNEKASIFNGLRLHETQKSLCYFPRICPLYRLLLMDRKPLHQPAILLRRQLLYFGSIPRPLKL